MTDIQPTDKRHTARLLALQFLFTQFFSEKNGIDYQAFEPQALLQINDEQKFSSDLYAQIIKGVEKFQNKMDVFIERVAPAWPIEQINPISLIIIRMSIWEAFVGQITPPKVVINEAIELDHELSLKSNSTFINGVLGSIFNNEDLKKELSDLNESK